MSPTEPAKPVFSNVDEESLLSKPISKLAIASIVLGVVGVLTPFTGALLIVPALAAVSGLFGSVLLARTNSSHSGGRLANWGLFLGLLSSTWTLVSEKTNRDTLTKNAGEFAAHFLENLADGNDYIAAELQQPFPSRQLPGLDLQTYYESYKGSTEPSSMAEDAEPDPRMFAKQTVEKIRAHALTQYARRYPNAKWTLSHLREITKRGTSQIVVVNMLNSEDPTQSAAIALSREVHIEKEASLADWFVKDMQLN